MSSILDALRQLETEGSQPHPEDLPPVQESNRSRGIVIALAGACVLGCLVVWMLWPSPPVPVAPAPGPDASLASAGSDALPPAAPASPPRAASAELPRATVTSKAPPTAEPMPEGSMARVPERAPEAVAAPRYEPPPDASASAGVGRTIPRPPGEPLVRIRSLSYSPSPTRRVVSLSVNNSNPLSVREGERIGGVEVTLIMPDGVYVKHNGNIFAVSR